MFRGIFCSCVSVVCAASLVLQTAAFASSGEKETKKPVKPKTGVAKSVKLEIKGTAYVVAADSISVMTKAGTVAQYPVTATTKVERNDKKAAITDVLTGDKVEIKTVNGVTVEVEAKGP